MVNYFFYKSSNLLFLYLLLPIMSIAQHSTFFTTGYGATETGASKTNLGIAQLEDGNMLFANRRGLLLYNSKTWKLFIAKDLDGRHVEFSKLLPRGNKIFAGGSADIGFWTKSQKGYTYQSLRHGKYRDQQFGLIMQIVEHQGLIFYVSLQEVIVTNGEKIIKVIPAEKEKPFVYFSKVEQQLFLSTYDGLLKWSPHNHSFRVITSDKKIPMLITSWDGKRVFVYFKAGVWVNSKKLDLGQKAREVLSNGVFTVKQYNQDQILITSYHTAYLLDLRKKTLKEVFSGKNLITDNYVDAYQNIWLVNNNKIYHIETASEFENYMPNADISSIITTKDGIFATSINKSLFWLKDEKLTKIELAGEAYSLCQVAGGGLLVGTLRGIFWVDYHTNSTKKVSDLNSIYFIKQDDEDKRIVYVATYDRLKVFRWSGNALNEIAEVEGAEGETIGLLRKGNFLWQGTKKAGLVRFKVDSSFRVLAKKSYYLNEGGDNNETMVREVDGVIWANNPGGIYKYNPLKDQFKLQDIQHGGTNFYYSIITFRDQAIFIAGQSNRFSSFGCAKKNRQCLCMGRQGI
jgi:hypothetical protein